METKHASQGLMKIIVSRNRFQIIWLVIPNKTNNTGSWVSFCFLGFLLSGKLRVIKVEDHAAHCRMTREIITKSTFQVQFFGNISIKFDFYILPSKDTASRKR